MHARMNRVTFHTDRLDEVERMWPEAVATYRDGDFRRGLLLLDRTSGRSVSVTLFGTEAAMRANETGALHKAAVGRFDDLRLTEPDKSFFEVGAVVEAEGGGAIGYARIADPTLKLATLETVVDGWAEHVRAYRGAAGFRGAYLLVDRTTGKANSISLWAAEADVRENEASGAFQATVEPYREMIAVPPTKSYWDVVADVAGAP